MSLIFKMIKAVFFFLLSFAYVFVMFSGKYSTKFIVICSIILLCLLFMFPLLISI